MIYGTGVEPWSQTLDSVSDYVKDEMEYLDRVFPQLGCLNVLALVKGTEVYMLRARHPVQITGVLESVRVARGPGPRPAASHVVSDGSCIFPPSPLARSPMATM